MGRMVSMYNNQNNSELQLLKLSHMMPEFSKTWNNVFFKLKATGSW